jgi:hypothetical protein
MRRRSNHHVHMIGTDISFDDFKLVLYPIQIPWGL